jgi:hypothetical protein
LESGFFAVRDPLSEAGMAVVRELLGDVDHLLAGGFMGSRPDHPILRRYVDALSTVLSEAEQLTPTWITTGGILLMKVIGDDPEAEILPSWTFFDRTLEGTPVTGGQPYARHFWSSTAGRDAHHSGAVPYPGQTKGSFPEEYDARTGTRAVVHRMVRRGKRLIRRMVGSDRR